MGTLGCLVYDFFFLNLVLVVLRMDPGVLHMLSKPSASELHGGRAFLTLALGCDV